MARVYEREEYVMEERERQRRLNNNSSHWPGGGAGDRNSFSLQPFPRDSYPRNPYPSYQQEPYSFKPRSTPINEPYERQSRWEREESRRRWEMDREMEREREREAFREPIREREPFREPFPSRDRPYSAPRRAPGTPIYKSTERYESVTTSPIPAPRRYERPPSPRREPTDPFDSWRGRRGTSLRRTPQAKQDSLHFRELHRSTDNLHADKLHSPRSHHYYNDAPYYSAQNLRSQSRNALNGQDPSALSRPGSPEQVAGVGDIVNTEHGFTIQLDVHHFRPEEIKVVLTGDLLCISGDRLEKATSPTGQPQQTLRRSFSRKYCIPADVKTESITSVLSDNGYLIVKGARRGWKETQITSHPPSYNEYQSRKSTDRRPTEPQPTAPTPARRTSVHGSYRDQYQQQQQQRDSVISHV